MKEIVLVAHGSRRDESNQEIRDLAARLADHLEDPSTRVSCAFLEISSPSIPEALDAAASGESSDVIVVPYFLAGGNHVREDVPRLVEEARGRHPDVRFRLSLHVGAAPEMTSLIRSLLPAAE